MNRRIVILGFMACGKTTVGAELARQLNCGFVDLDSFIAEREGRQPAEIIEHDGETTFREIETLALSDVLANQNSQVVALGGGTWTIPANRTVIALHQCLTVWLDAPFELCWKRINAAESARPLAPDFETATRRFDERREYYALAQLRIAVNADDSVTQVVEQIFRET